MNIDIMRKVNNKEYDIKCIVLTAIIKTWSTSKTKTLENNSVVMFGPKHWIKINIYQLVYVKF